MINEGILPDTLPKRTAIPNPINKDSWKSKTRIPLRKPQPSGPLAKDFSNKNMIKNRYGQWVEQKPKLFPIDKQPLKPKLEDDGIPF